MHISKRDGIETWKSWLIRIIAVLLSLVVCAGVIVALTGLNPIEVYKGIFDGAIGTKRRAFVIHWCCYVLQLVLPRHLKCVSGTLVQKARC